MTTSEEAVLLASTQAALISTPECARFAGNAPELLSVGHNPYPGSAFNRSIVLPSHSRRKTLVEFLYETSLEEKAAGGEGVRGMKKRRRLQQLVKSWQDAGLDTGYGGLHQQRPYMAKGDTTYGIGHHVPYGIHLLAADSVLSLSTNTMSVVHGAHDVPGEVGEGGGAQWPPEEFNPHRITAFIEGLSAREQRILASQRFSEYFYESRIAALERWVGRAAMCMGDACMQWVFIKLLCGR